MRSVYWSNIELLFPGVGQKGGVVHRVHEGVFQHLHRVRRQPGRRYEGTAEAVPGIKKVDRLPVLWRAREFIHERYILEVGVRRNAALEENHNLLAWNPVGSLAGDTIE